MSVAHTSITPEPFGRVIVEGMLAQRPVVAARAGGVMEIIDDHENGMLCTPGDAHGLADTLAELRSNDDLRNQAGQQRLSDGAEPVRHGDLCRWCRADSEARGGALRSAGQSERQKALLDCRREFGVTGLTRG